MKNALLSFAVLMVVMVLAGMPEPAPAADNANYSGKYLAERPKEATAGAAAPTLEVVQNLDAIEITLVESGKRTKSRCPLSGSEGDYASPGGISGKCRAHLNEKNLIVESVIVTHPQPNANVRMHTKERWQLSKDSKTLTIKTDVDFPDFPRCFCRRVGRYIIHKEIHAD